MSKDQAAGSDTERKQWAQMVIEAKYRNLYPEWETVGVPYMEGGKELLRIRKWIG